jgi:hypothetical protein
MMTSGNPLLTAIPLTMLLLPVAWLSWRTVRTRKWDTGLPVLAGALMFLGMGVFCLCFTFHRARVLERRQGVPVLVDHYTAPLYREESEPISLPPDASAYVAEEPKKFHSRSSGTYTSHEVYLRAPGGPHRLKGFRERAAAQALVDEVGGFMKGHSPRVELQQADDNLDDMEAVRAFMGALGYLAGLGLIALGSVMLREGPVAARQEGPKQRPARRRPGRHRAR